MRRGFCVTGILLLIGINGIAQETEIPAESDGKQEIPLVNMLPGFRDKAVVLEIQARVIEQNALEIWNELHQRVTIPGRPVGIKMVGSNVIVAAQFIPYLRRRGQNILVAQGQIWIDIPNQGIRYQTTMQTIPLAFDEPVYFFPLGSSGHAHEARIEIVLTMRSYRDSLETETATQEIQTDANAQENSPQ